MKVLTINSYGGSLLLAARERDDHIIGSYEDAGYGTDIQRMNFPDVECLESRHNWPGLDPRFLNLRETVVIAHPPCAAFSNQNRGNPALRGTEAKKFNCTIDAITYALQKSAAALAVESVPAALEGARQVHDALAKDFGYAVYRITQNACQFGLAQWRPRFWVIFTRTPTFTTWLPIMPDRRIHHVMDGSGPLTFNPTLLRDTDHQLAHLQEMEPAYWEVVLREGVGLVHTEANNFARRFDNNKDAQLYYSIKRGFASHHLRLLDPRGYATTIMSDSWFYCGRLLANEEYCEIMGFPRDYLWGRYQTRFREFLSRGVCPPVARWILDMIDWNLHSTTKMTQPCYTLEPGETADYAALAKKPKEKHESTATE